MKVVLNDSQLVEAVRLYASMITGMACDESVAVTVDYKPTGANKGYSVEIPMKKPSVAKPALPSRDITQADLDKTYKSVADRKLDVS